MRGALAFAFALALAAMPACAAVHYRAAALQPDGRLRLTTTQGAVVWAPLDHEGEPEPQSEFSEPRIAPDGRTVGWLALYPGCCQSYAIPLSLVLFRDGKVLRGMTGAGMPVWHWRFIDGGRQVAFVQRPTHGAAPDHYELRDVASGRLLAEFDHDEGDARPLPRWARGVQTPGE
ncbi:MAG: hypothetical protein HOQ02_11085 [Lysobacter sp.]|nr:hypothetical protein [Lysobacter sp.]